VPRGIIASIPKPLDLQLLMETLRGLRMGHDTAMAASR
jgi:hypothetical protein